MEPPRELEARSHPRGAILFRQGDPGDAAYIVTAGTIGLYREAQGRRVPLASVRPGEVFGELVVADGSTRQASAVALEDSATLVLPADVLAARLDTADPLVRLLVKILAGNLRQVHDAYTPRSRSLLDAVNSLARQYDVVSRFLRGNVPADVREQAELRLKPLAERIREMREVAMAHRRQDRRDDAIPHEADLPL
jgi:CRP-like cAMP-binding protein